MAKKQSTVTGRPRGRARRQPWSKRLLRSVLLLPFRYWRLTLGAVIVALLYWQREAVVWWALGVIRGMLRLFGWGSLFLALAAATLVGIAWLRRFPAVVRHWHRWLGGIAFVLAIWGILAFFPGKGVLWGVSLGGSFGQVIIGYTGVAGMLRVAGLIIAGIILLAPRASFQLVSESILWLGKQWRHWPSRRLTSRPVRQPKPSLPSVAVARPSATLTPSVAVSPEPVEMESAREAAALARSSAPSREEIRQVAQEVWKKYGESADLVVVDGWRLPPLSILEMTDRLGSRTPEADDARAEFVQQADNIKRARVIEEALASYGVEAKVVQINAGPTVTQFGVEPGWDRKTKEIRERDKDGNVRLRVEEVSKTRVKVDRITSLANDLALALAAPSIRIEAPVPGKSVVGIEVPNIVSNLVSLRGVIETNVFQRTEARSKMSLALGKGAGGEAVAADLAKMPHLLIAGATGSGKTVCLDAIICCLLLYNTPNDVQFIMIDPKRVELTMFNSIPHLVVPVIVDTDKALDALRWLGQEMDKRYHTLAAAASRNIEGYNKNRQGKEKMPYLVLVIDELADLMMAGGDEVENILCRLAQLSRAIGIHLVVATQRPSVDVVTGLIKANFPTRISFAVTSQVDSRTILDGGGAEKLLGRGDMLFMPTEAAKPKRLQGCFVSDAEAERLVYFWGNQRREEAPSLKIEALVPSRLLPRKAGLIEDPVLEAARRLAQEHTKISASFLQRRLRIGYPRAARIIDQLEEEKAQDEGED